MKKNNFEINEKNKKSWLKELSNYGITEEDYESINKNLTKKFNKEARSNDIIWALFNNALINNLNNLSVQSLIYYDMGRFIRYQEQKDPNQYFGFSTKLLLKDYQSKGIKKVRFLATISERTCKSCSSMNGKKFDIDEAI